MVTTQTNLEGTGLSEMSERERQTVPCCHLYVESKNSEKQRVKRWLPRAGGNGEMLVRGYKLSAIRQVSSGDLMYSMVMTVNNTVLYS